MIYFGTMMEGANVNYGFMTIYEITYDYVIYLLNQEAGK